MARGLFTRTQHIQGIVQRAWNNPAGTYAASFNGTSQYLTSSINANLALGTSSFTVEYWLYMYKNANRAIVTFGGTGANFDAFFGYAADEGVNAQKIQWYLTSNASTWNITGGYSAIVMSGLIPINMWHHIAFVRNGDTFSMYIDGQLINSGTNSSSIYQGANSVMIGNGQLTSYFPGLISNFRFVKGTSVYTANFTPPRGPLSAISGTQLLTLQDPTFIDNSSNGITFTNTGSVPIQTAYPFTQLTTPAVDYLVVAGGGGGGYAGGGGGAGGLLQGTVSVVTGSSITVTVGGGGAAATQSDGSTGGSGQNSVLGSITALGGGGGGAYNGSSTTGQAGVSGGSGGGGATISGAYRLNQGGQGTSGQGNSGGIGHLSNGQPYAGAGGGGAGTVGFTGGSSSQYDNIDNSGGAGIASAISGTVTTYAGGGSGSRAGGAYVVYGVGGVGGGGNQNASGGVNTGGGGGGGGAAGGSGIVIVSYPDIYAAAASTTGSPTVSTSGSGSIYFNTSTAKISYGTSSNLALGAGNWTVEFFVYIVPNGNEVVIVDWRSASSAPTLIPLVSINSSNYPVFNQQGGSGILTSSTAVTPNAWTHVAFARSSNVITAYVNGTASGTVSHSSTLGIQEFYLNHSIANSGQFYGYLSNVRVVVGTAIVPPTGGPTSPLTAVNNTQFLLNSVSGSPFVDSSTNCFTPTVTSTPVWNQLSPFATGLGYKNRVYTWTSSGSITF
jgi:hypothetical protein